MGARYPFLLRSAGWVVVASCLLQPLTGFSQIYKWVDEKGVTVFSNVRPADSQGLKNFQVAITQDKLPGPPAAAAPARPAPPAPPAANGEAAQRATEAAENFYREQALQARVANLERQLQAAQYAAPAPQAAVVPDYSGMNYGYAPGYGYPGGFGYPSFGYPGYGVSYAVPLVVSPGFVSRRPAFAAPRFTAPSAFPHHGGRAVGERAFRSPTISR